MSDAWYELVSAGTRITQGDLIFSCPLLEWKAAELAGEDEQQALNQMAFVTKADVVILTQACDLENSKVPNVVLSPHNSISSYKLIWADQRRQSNQNPTQKAWQSFCRALVDGYFWNLTMLNESSMPEFPMENRVVDFHEVYTVPRIFLESLLNRRQQSRIRLLPPYREHLSQAFARFFMRVGLPVEVAKVWE